MRRSINTGVAVWISFLAHWGPTGFAQGWVADQADGTYRNPVLYSDYSDPDVCLVGSDYYMTASSFTCMPGLPILHSRDLVNWRLIGHALDRMPLDPRYDRPQHGKSVWAPSIRFHDGRFMIYWGDPDLGICMVQASAPTGPWSEPVVVKAGRGLIDPCPFWDTDGQAYLVHAWAASRAQVNSLLTLHRLSADGTRVIDAGRHVFDGHGRHRALEGPKMYRRGEFYYIFAPAGGVPRGWQVVLRSRQVDGPYEDRIVLAQGPTDINGPHQGAWVESPAGRLWFVHFQEKQPYGRIVHLQPMRWVDGWPVMGTDPDGDGCGQPVPGGTKPVSIDTPPLEPVTSDEFDGRDLGLQWQWNANPDLRWSALIPGSGFLRLFGLPMTTESRSLWDVPQLLLQKFPAPSFTATTHLTLHAEDAQAQAGLIVFGRDYFWLGLQGGGSDRRLLMRQCRRADRGGTEQTLESRPWPQDYAVLRLEVRGPDGRCRFQVQQDSGDFAPFGPAFQAREGVWIGAKVGLFCVTGSEGKVGSYADADWFRVTVPE